MMQAGVIANVLTGTVNADNIRASRRTIVARPADQTKTSTLQEIKKIFSIFRFHGNREAVRYLLALKDIRFLIFFALGGLIIILSGQAFIYIRDFSSAFLSVRVCTDIRKHMFNELIMLPSSYLKDQSSGDIISRSLNDILSIQATIYIMFEAMLFGPAMTAIGLAYMFYLNWKFSLILILTACILGFLIYLISSLLRKIVKNVQENLSSITEHLQKILYGIDIVKIFNRESWEKRHFRKLLKQFLHASGQERALLKLNRPINEMFGTLALVGIIFYAANLIWHKSMSIEEMFQFILILIYIAPYFSRMGTAILTKQQLDVYAERIQEVLSHPPEQTNTVKKQISHFCGNIVFQNVSFSYGNASAPAVENISFDVRPGEFAAIVGASGSGKTTLINLVPRLINPSRGTILFDNTDYMTLSLREIRSFTSYVSQESVLFPGTVMSNIRYGKLTATDEEVFHAAACADIHDFIITREHGYNSIIGDRGLALSGGQRQRICIARAILKKPKIMLLDEATSALDLESEAAIQRAIESLISRQTTLVIAHRLSTVMKAHKIIVLDKGSIAEIGTHDELIAQKGVYSRLYHIQSNA